MHEQNELRLELAGSASDFLSPTSMLFALRDGRMITMSLLVRCSIYKYAGRDS